MLSPGSDSEGSWRFYTYAIPLFNRLHTYWVPACPGCAPCWGAEYRDKGKPPLFFTPSRQTGEWTYDCILGVNSSLKEANPTHEVKAGKGDHQILEETWGVSSVNSSYLNLSEPHWASLKNWVQVQIQQHMPEAYHGAKTDKLLLNNPLLLWKFSFSTQPILWAPLSSLFALSWGSCHHTASQLHVILIVCSFCWDVSQIFPNCRGMQTSSPQIPKWGVTTGVGGPHL